MTFTMPQFPMLNFEEANPMLTSQKYQNALQQQALQNQITGVQAQFAQPMANQALQKEQLANALSQIKLKYADPQEKAALALAQAQPGEVLARTGLLNKQSQWVGPQAQANIAQALASAQAEKARASFTGTQQNLLQNQMPYLVQQEQSKLFSDPIIQRQFQLQLAKQQNPQMIEEMKNLGLIGASQNEGISPTTTPRLFNGNAAQNYALFGSPFNPIEMQQLSSQAKTAGSAGVTNYNDALKQANESSSDAIQMKNYINEFSHAYDKSKYKGPVAGSTPSSGFKSALVPGDLSNEQTADNAAANMQAMMTKLMHFNKLTNYELQFTGNLKLNRAMTPQTMRETRDFLLAKSQRLQEEQQFLNTAQKQGIDINTARTLWNQYDSQRPVYNFEKRKINLQNNSKWRNYLSNEAVDSIQNGETYFPNIDKMSRNELDQLSPETKMMMLKQLQGNK